MKTFTIIEFDRDYRRVSDTLYKSFNDLTEAEQWCKDNSWTGHLYWVDVK